MTRANCLMYLITWRDPADELGKVYVGTTRAFLCLRYATGTWMNLTKKLPNAMVVDLVYQEKERTLHAATYGRSIWRLKLT